MTERQTIRPESVQAAAAAVVAALQPGIDADWSVRAGDLEWSVDQTISHMTVHTYDVTRGLGLPYEPPGDLCRLVLEHELELLGRRWPELLHPDQDEQRPAWPLLVWLSGRPHPAATGWGQPPRPGGRSELALEFARDPATGEWRAIRWAT